MARGAPEIRSRILVVEDDEEQAWLLSVVLEGLGYAVTIAGTAQEALRLLDGASPAAVVTDMMIPGASGLRFLEHLRSRPETRDVPALMITASADEELARVVGGMPRAAFLKKPFGTEDLTEALRRLIERG